MAVLPEISIIVPVYRVEQYLCRCVDSILNQTFSNIEVILVNDGSPDRCGQICNEYAHADSRVRVVHKKNGGLSSARNAGLEIARGRFVGFVDSDDWIEPDMFELLHTAAVNNNADISVCRILGVPEDEHIEFSTRTSRSFRTYNREEAMEAMFDRSFSYSACNKLYRKGLFEGVRYPEGKLMEDKATTYRLIHKSKCVVFNESTKYHYFLRSGSIVRSEFNPRILDSLDIHAELSTFIEENYPNLHGLVRCKYATAALKILVRMMKSNYYDKDIINRCVRVVRENAYLCIFESRIGWATKFWIMVSVAFPWIFSLGSKYRMFSEIAKNVL